VREKASEQALVLVQAQAPGSAREKASEPVSGLAQAQAPELERGSVPGSARGQVSGSAREQAWEPGSVQGPFPIPRRTRGTGPAVSVSAGRPSADFLRTAFRKTASRRRLRRASEGRSRSRAA
jgi:hypothetical protein